MFHHLPFGVIEEDYIACPGLRLTYSTDQGKNYVVLFIFFEFTVLSHVVSPPYCPVLDPGQPGDLPVCTGCIKIRDLLCYFTTSALRGSDSEAPFDQGSEAGPVPKRGQRTIKNNQRVHTGKPGVHGGTQTAVGGWLSLWGVERGRREGGVDRSVNFDTQQSACSVRPEDGSESKEIGWVPRLGNVPLVKFRITDDWIL
eukprot:767598-Hanusia_phi.AAC.2